MSNTVNKAGRRPNLSERFAELQLEVEGLRSRAFIKERELEIARAEAERLREQLTSLPDLREQVVKMAKELDSAKNIQKWSNERARNAENELEQAHAVLDGVSGAPSREYEQEYGKGTRNVVTRLAGAFLAIAQKGAEL